MINSTEKKTDLHLHSNASDGIYSPSELIQLASQRGLSAVALTDHETTEGISEAREAGAENGVEVVSGVEISAGFNGRELHILGYLSSIRPELESILRKLRRGRFKRMEKMIDNLEKMSVTVTWAEIKKEAGNAAPGRLHLARMLQEKGYVQSLTEAFDNYLGKGCPAYIPRDKLKIAEAINILIECDAIPILAHPGVTQEDSKSLYQLVSYGLKGIEVFHPEHTDGLTLFYKNWAEKEGLLITGGSDFHGDKKNSCPYPGCVSVDYSYLESLKNAYYK